MSTDNVNIVFRFLKESSTVTNSKAMKHLSFLSVIFILGEMTYKAYAETQQCPAFGSEQSISGWMLRRHIYKTMMADLGLHCLLVCHTDDRCQSFNFVMSLHMCEFSDRTKEARPEDFTPDSDRYYFRRNIKRGKWNIIIYGNLYVNIENKTSLYFNSSPSRLHP